MNVSKIKVNRVNIKDCKNILQALNDMGLFDNCSCEDNDFQKIKVTDWIELTPDYIDISEEKQTKEKYFILYDAEQDKILSYNKTKINNRELLTLFCYYAARQYHRKFYTDKNGNKVKKSLQMDRSEVCYPQYKEIVNDTGISENAIKKYNDILVELGLIICKSAGNRHLTVDNKTVILSSPNTVCLCRTSLDVANLEVDESIKVYIKNQKANGAIFVSPEKTGKEMSKKQISNTITRLQTIKNKTGLTKTQEAKLNKYLLLKENFDKTPEDESKNTVWENKMLLDNNQNKLLSDIFNNMGRWKEAEKYLDIEQSLGMVNVTYDDEDNEVKELLIDFDYYKWVMVTYLNDNDKREMLINSVAKHRREKLKEQNKFNAVHTSDPQESVWGDNRMSTEEQEARYRQMTDNVCESEDLNDGLPF